MSARLNLSDEKLAELRLECLKLAYAGGGRGLDAIATARAYADFLTRWEVHASRPASEVPAADA